MSTKPLYNAIIASGYISLIVIGLNLSQKIATGPDNLLMPMGALGLLVLSVAIMGYLFFYQPVHMLLDSKPKEAVTFFLKTVVAFAVIVLIVLGVSLFISR